jgi:hypothetical protein
VVAALAATAVCALEVPPTPTTHLTDLAGAIPATQAAAVEDRLGALERQTGHQVIAVFLPSLEGEALEDFTIRCAERWKVGRKGLDDGIIFFTFVRDRKMRLEVGYGLESKVPDAVAAQLLDDAVRPAFRAGDYGGGVVALADDLGRVFRGDPPPEGGAKPPVEPALRRVHRPRRGVPPAPGGARWREAAGGRRGAPARRVAGRRPLRRAFLRRRLLFRGRLLRGRRCVGFVVKGQGRGIRAQGSGTTTGTLRCAAGPEETWKPI